MRFRPRIFFVVYVGLVFFYASIYHLLKDGFKGELSWIDSIYFSTVTISTLGYGDILPVSNAAKIVVSTEAIFGIVVIGVFLSSLWQSHISQLEARQELEFNERTWILNAQKLVSYNSYLTVQLHHYRHTLFEITTPITQRNGRGTPNPLFKFSDLQDLFKPSLLLVSDFQKPLAQKYFENLDMISNELKYILANFSLVDFPKIHSTIVGMLTAFATHDVKGVVLFYSKENISIKESVVEIIKEHDDCPSLEEFRSNIITPIIILFNSLRINIELIGKLEEEFLNLHHELDRRTGNAAA